MNGLKRRIKRLERVARPGREKPIRIVFQDAGETSAETMKKAGIKPDDESLTVIIIEWASGHEPGYPLYNHLAAEKAAETQKAVTEIDSELQQLRSELNKETQQ